MGKRPAGHDPALEFVQSLAFAAAFCAGLALSLAFAAGAFHRQSGPVAVHSVGQINPNDASEASLSRLPGIGPTRARAIIALRERLQDQNGRSSVFQNAEDLAQVKGIGPATVDGMRPWLRFDASLNEANELATR